MTTAGRRRGAALEQAMLDATWAELVDFGYPGLTLEGVAKRAGTSRPVLARRWPSRTALTTAAIAHFIANNPVNLPDLGSVRDELADLFRQWSARGVPLILRIFLDMSADLSNNNSSFAGVKSELRQRLGNRDLVAQILERGISRGEIDAKRLTPRIASLPADLMRHEVIMTSKPISERAIAEILDEIFLPLVAARTP
jgi:AcrR family transcriptional regulator